MTARAFVKTGSFIRLPIEDQRKAFAKAKEEETKEAERRQRLWQSAKRIAMPAAAALLAVIGILMVLHG